MSPKPLSSMRIGKASTAVLLLLGLLALAGCASLGGLSVQAPRFDVADSDAAELRLLAPSLQRPLGGAALRIRAEVENPNPIGITLSTLAGTLRLAGREAAEFDFPLGVPLAAGGSEVVPLDIAISFANLPALAEVLTRAVSGDAVAYSLVGTTSVDAGLLGQPVFGPMTLLQGSVDVRR